MFLVTGLPRTRSAWFAALLGAAHAPNPQDYARLKNVCDPSAACLYPDTALKVWQDAPIVIIERDPVIAGTALSEWAGHPVWGTGWDVILHNYRHFKESARTKSLRVAKFEDLDSYSVVNALVVHVTGEPLSRERFDLFNGIKIEQHLGKAKRAINQAA